jgi:hypothetical protein
MEVASYTSSRRSTLTFATSSPPTELSELKRVREPVSRSKAGVQGKVADFSLGRSLHTESLNELKGFRVLIATGGADLCREQPFRLEYRDMGMRHCYTPDVLVVWGSCREVVEIPLPAPHNCPVSQASCFDVNRLGCIARMCER